MKENSICSKIKKTPYEIRIFKKGLVLYQFHYDTKNCQLLNTFAKRSNILHLKCYILNLMVAIKALETAKDIRQTAVAI